MGRELYQEMNPQVLLSTDLVTSAKINTTESGLKWHRKLVPIDIAGMKMWLKKCLCINRPLKFLLYKTAGWPNKTDYI